jgi:hypothetical protein
MGRSFGGARVGPINHVPAAPPPHPLFPIPHLPVLHPSPIPIPVTPPLFVHPPPSPNTPPPPHPTPACPPVPLFPGPSVLLCLCTVWDPSPSPLSPLFHRRQHPQHPPAAASRGQHPLPGAPVRPHEGRPARACLCPHPCPDQAPRPGARPPLHVGPRRHHAATQGYVCYGAVWLCIGVRPPPPPLHSPLPRLDPLLPPTAPHAALTPLCPCFSSPSYSVLTCRSMRWPCPVRGWEGWPLWLSHHRPAHTQTTHLRTCQPSPCAPVDRATPRTARNK